MSAGVCGRGSVCPETLRLICSSPATGSTQDDLERPAARPLGSGGLQQTRAPHARLWSEGDDDLGGGFDARLGAAGGQVGASLVRAVQLLAVAVVQRHAGWKRLGLGGGERGRRPT